MTLLAQFGPTEPCNVHGLTVEQAMQKFVWQYNAAVSAVRAQPIDVIHGHNQGTAIRETLRAFLAKHADKASADFGELLDGNEGYTRIYPNKPLPEWEQSLHSRILSFCASPKPRERILSQFARYGEPCIRAALNDLVRRGDLKPMTKNRRVCLIAATFEVNR